MEVSPAMVTVGAYLQRQREGKTGDKERLRFLHADARHTGLEAGSVDLVSMCLVAHETPQFAMRELAQEAMRILRPGGAFCIMEQVRRERWMICIMEQVRRVGGG